MSRNACEFLEAVKHKQHRWWLVLLLWWICVIALVLAVSELFKNIPAAAVRLAFYASVVLLFIPAIRLYRLKCPYCDGSSGAFPFLRYKALRCKSCGERIECHL
jgi:hypothetical protein